MSSCFHVVSSCETCPCTQFAQPCLSHVQSPCQPCTRILELVHSHLLIERLIFYHLSLFSSLQSRPLFLSTQRATCPLTPQCEPNSSTTPAPSRPSPPPPQPSASYTPSPRPHPSHPRKHSTSSTPPSTHPPSHTSASPLPLSSTTPTALHPQNASSYSSQPKTQTKRPNPRPSNRDC